MINSLLELPLIAGLLIFVVITVITGYLSYYGARQLLPSKIPRNSVRLANILLRITGSLLALILSLTFADAHFGMIKYQESVNLEAARITDIYNDLYLFDTQESFDIQQDVIVYIRSLIEDEWPMLGKDSFSLKTFDRAIDLKKHAISLKPITEEQRILKSDILKDIDEISDFRQIRSHGSKHRLSVFFYIAAIGFILTISLTSVFVPNKTLFFLMGIACSFVGIVTFFILELNLPFNGSIQVSTGSLEYLLSLVK